MSGAHGVVLLAAGFSRRLGTSKALLEIDGTPLVRRAAAAALATRPRELVVVANDDRVARALADLPSRVVACADAAEGMAASLRAGVAALDARCDAALVLLCDQPALDASHLEALLAARAAHPDAAVATFYSEVRGAPAVFPRAWFARLLALRGDAGARGLLRARGADVVDVAAPAYAHDIDTAEDLA